MEQYICKIADPQAITFVLKNDNKINSKEYLQSSYDISKPNIQVSNHTCGVLLCSRVKVIAGNTEFVTCSLVNKNSHKNGKKLVKNR